MRVSELAAEYFERQILPRWKHPDILRRRIDKDINPCIGSMKVEDVKPRHIDDMLKGIVDRGAPTIATDVLAGRAAYSTTESNGTRWRLTPVQPLRWQTLEGRRLAVTAG
jgi:hypothetical protein